MVVVAIHPDSPRENVHTCPWYDEYSSSRMIAILNISFYHVQSQGVPYRYTGCISGHQCVEGYDIIYIFRRALRLTL